MVKLEKFIEECDEEKIRNFPLCLDGPSYGATKKKSARLSIAVPKVVIGENLMDKDKWWWRIIVVEKKEAKRVFKKLSKKK